MNWSIRYANEQFTIEDGHDQLDKINDSLGEPAANEGFSIIRRLNNGQVPSKILVAKQGDKVIGVGGMKPCSQVRNAERVSQFYIHPDHRRSGVAKTLAKKLINESPYLKITCESHESEGTRKFWESLGFKPTDGPGEVTHILNRA